MAKRLVGSWLSWKAMKRLADRDRLLKVVGLEERSPVGDLVTGLGLFSVGVLVGAALGLAFAPRRGTEIRAIVGERLRRRDGSAADLAPEFGAEAGVTPAMAR